MIGLEINPFLEGDKVEHLKCNYNISNQHQLIQHKAFWNQIQKLTLNIEMMHKIFYGKLCYYEVCELSKVSLMKHPMKIQNIIKNEKSKSILI